MNGIVNYSAFSSATGYGEFMMDMNMAVGMRGIRARAHPGHRRKKEDMDAAVNVRGDCCEQIT
jgi:hypothetical protein